MKTLLLFSICGTAFAQLERPRIGMMLDADGNARVVYGVDASVTVSEPVWTGVLSLACSVELCVAKTQTALISTSGDAIEAPDGPAILAVDGASVYAYSSERRQLYRWHDGQLEPLSATTDGEVAGIRVSRDGPQFIMRATENAVLPVGNGVLLATDESIRLGRADGTESSFPVADVRSFVRMAENYVQMITARGSWVLRMDAGHEQVFLLPGVGQAGVGQE